MAVLVPPPSIHGVRLASVRLLGPRVVLVARAHRSVDAVLVATPAC